MGSLEVLRIGAPCVIGDNIGGFIHEICIGEKNRITYHVVYWIEMNRKTTWLTEREVKGRKKNKVKIGFIQDQN